MTLAVVLVLTLVGCSSADDASGSEDSQPASDQQDSADDLAIPGMDPNFDMGSLPDDFPTQVLPDSVTAGMYRVIQSGQDEIRSATFESSSSFDDLLAEYTAMLGEPSTGGGPEGTILALWAVDDWRVRITRRDSWTLVEMYTNS